MVVPNKAKMTAITSKKIKSLLKPKKPPPKQLKQLKPIPFTSYEKFHTFYFAGKEVANCVRLFQVVLDRYLYKCQTGKRRGSGGYALPGEVFQ
jgi:hypothetical protein